MNNTNLPIVFNPPTDHILMGSPAKWAAETGWVDGDGLKIPSTPMVILHQRTFLRQWKDKLAIDIIKHPLPDPAELNAALPKPWPVGLDGQEQAPWALHYCVYFCDPNIGSLYTWANRTWGSQRAYRALEERTMVMRSLRGTNVTPVVELDQCMMKTKVGQKPRPHFKILEFRTTGGVPDPSFSIQPAAPQLTGPVPEAAAAPAPKTMPDTTVSCPAQHAGSVLDRMPLVKPATTRELISDELPPGM